jgi:hypothetical protein
MLNGIDHVAYVGSRVRLKQVDFSCHGYRPKLYVLLQDYGRWPEGGCPILLTCYRERPEEKGSPSRVLACRKNQSNM